MRPVNRSGRLHLCLVVLLLLSGFALRARHLDAPAGERLREITLTNYYGVFERAYLEHGLAGTRFGLVFRWWPGITEGMVRDVNHPTLPSYLFHAGVLLTGELELGLRLVPFLCACLGLLTLYFVARLGLGRNGALFALLLAATSPMAVYYGPLVAAEAFLLPWGCLVLLATWRLLSGRGSFAALLGVFFVGTLIDWHLFFFAPAAWVVGGLRPRGQPFPRRLLTLFGVGCLGFLIYVLHASWAVGGFDQLVDTMTHKLDRSSTWDYSAGAWFAAQGRYMLSWYRAPVLVLALIGLLGLPRRLLRRDEAINDRSTLFFLVAGGLSLVFFLDHSLRHEFWTMGLAGGIYLAAAGALERARRHSAVAAGAVIAVAGVVAIFGARDSLRYQELTQTTRFQDDAERANALVDSGDVVVATNSWWQRVMYVEAQMVDRPVRSLPQLQQVILTPMASLYAESETLPRVFVFVAEADAGEASVRELASWLVDHGAERQDIVGYGVYEIPPAVLRG